MNTIFEAWFLNLLHSILASPNDQSLCKIKILGKYMTFDVISSIMVKLILKQ
jgi:hypothetical protein